MTARRWLGLHGALVLLFLYLPIAVIVVLSFNESKYGVAWHGFTLKWYAQLFEHGRVHTYLRNSLVVATTSTAISTVLGTLLALGLARYRFFGRGALLFLLYVPVVIPDVVMGVSLLLFFAWVRQYVDALHLSLTTVILGHVTFQVAYVTLVVKSRLAGLDPSLEEAAADLGAGGWARFWKITFPLIWPGVVAAALLAFTLSLDDFVVTFFTAGPGATTLPIYIFSSVKRGVTPEIHALSTLMILVTSLALIAVQRVSTRR
ncbi:ABC transporter permease [Oceanithermus sp.]|uniref:ABC transporter permease n=1 Tax=Oceanithermus sp. TaxID=2268145 RepID=UPI0025F43522|nr:ABC transporter permease [Oceanithermus sp.]